MKLLLLSLLGLYFFVVVHSALASGGTPADNVMNDIIATYAGTINVLIVAVAILSAVAIGFALFDYIQK